MNPSTTWDYILTRLRIVLMLNGNEIVLITVSETPSGNVIQTSFLNSEQLS